ncbi:hypothetical protein BDV96DRAFT_506589 [Lophiotrema nucula]|uniref:Rhodopsin domain-containing protein n=1 Tax=Lophiotrema nucula TaxID=690887 RepID=A0A6A5YJB4_9PLEO|nr:hypothetical protein BDV96DRAFT_506589 [Lophiotrema nucula]
MWYYGTCIHAVTAGKLGIHLWDISVAHITSDDFLIASFFSNIISAPVWALAKTSFFLMYLQLFQPLVWVKWSCYIGVFVCWGFYIAIFTASVYYQAPGYGQSWQEGKANARYENIRHMALPIAAGNLILDVYIFIIPLVVSWNLHLKRSKRLGLIAVFGTGLLAVISSTLSIVVRVLLNTHINDFTYWVWPTLLLCLTEMTFGIACSCMPATAGFFKRGHEGSRFLSGISSIFSLRSFGSNRSNNSSSASSHYTIGSKPKGNKNPKKIIANTYITIEHDWSSTHELTGMSAIEGVRNV